MLFDSIPIPLVSGTKFFNLLDVHGRDGIGKRPYGMDLREYDNSI